MQTQIVIMLKRYFKHLCVLVPLSHPKNNIQNKMIRKTGVAYHTCHKSTKVPAKNTTQSTIGYIPILDRRLKLV